MKYANILHKNKISLIAIMHKNKISMIIVMHKNKIFKNLILHQNAIFWIRIAYNGDMPKYISCQSVKERLLFYYRDTIGIPKG